MNPTYIVKKCSEVRNIEELVKYKYLIEMGETVKVIDCDNYFTKIDTDVFYKVPNEDLFRVIEGKDYSFKGDA